MAKKATINFNIDNEISRISKPSVFDRIVKEIDAKEIPAKYIDHILVQYNDGNVVELSGKEINFPIPLNKSTYWEMMENSFKKMKDVKIFISLNRLELDINIMVENFLGSYC